MEIFNTRAKNGRASGVLAMDALDKLEHRYERLAQIGTSALAALSVGVFERNDLKALRPPAEAPMPTIKPPSVTFERARAAAPSLPREALDLAFAKARLPRGLF